PAGWFVLDAMGGRRDSVPAAVRVGSELLGCWLVLASVLVIYARRRAPIVGVEAGTYWLGSTIGGSAILLAIGAGLGWSIPNLQAPIRSVTLLACIITIGSAAMLTGLRAGTLSRAEANLYWIGAALAGMLGVAIIASAVTSDPRMQMGALIAVFLAVV